MSDYLTTTPWAWVLYSIPGPCGTLRKIWFPYLNHRLLNCDPPVPFFTSPIMSWTQTVLALPLRRLWVLSRSSPMAHFYFGQNDSVFSHSFAHVFSVCSYSRSCIRLSLTSGLGYQIAHIGTGGTDWTACRGICWSSVPCGGHQKVRDVRHAMSQLRWSMWVWCFSDLVFYRSTPLPFIYMLLSQPSRTS